MFMCTREETQLSVSYGESAEKAFRNISDNDANEKDNGFQQVVTKHQWNDEKQHSKADCKNRYEMNKFLDFTANWSHVLLQSRR